MKRYLFAVLDLVVEACSPYWALIKRTFYWAWIALVTLLMGMPLILDEHFFVEAGVVFSAITWVIVLQMVALAAVVLTVRHWLLKSWWMFHRGLFGGPSKQKASAAGARGVDTNYSMAPAHIPWLGLAFLGLLFVNLPALAGLEETIFRKGTESWLGGLWRSFAFGVMHMYVGVSFGTAMALAVAGLWFTHVYFIGGVDLATVHHTAYNCIWISLGILVTLVEHVLRVARWRRQRPAPEAA